MFAIEAISNQNMQENQRENRKTKAKEVELQGDEGISKGPGLIQILKNFHEAIAVAIITTNYGGSEDCTPSETFYI